MGPITGEDGLARCPWAASTVQMRDYHDQEWGAPVHGEAAYLERMTLEAFQSGLSWAVILAKRPGFRAAFADFDADRIADLDAGDVDRLLGDPGIVRNRRKIEATLTNARATVALREHGGLEQLVLAHTPPVEDAPVTVADWPARTTTSTALAKELKRHGFVFVGPTTMYALMQAIGLVDPHLAGCHRRGSRG
ncbi:DNA-3-methyladenine glycosylase I [Nocardioides sambongensis]|uniref:DNA-3-methyladenine glycosylase I n=1 Tax=Nocardioides sambongensis TaxID=2589074 RepID=UPI00112630CA|nr:DNA-3-methyladenine glycosylase I [Nocardioides sambongensis]